MENFKNKLKVNSETMEKLNAINQEYKKSGREIKILKKNCHRSLYGYFRCRY